MTLSEILPVVQQLPAVDKLRLIRILAETLDPGEDIRPLEPYKTYAMPTPYGMFGAGGALMKALEEAKGGSIAICHEIQVQHSRSVTGRVR
jgi:hypothetical protein